MNHGITIPTPCHEDWNLMTPEAQGRHCLACAKTVVDFTGWTVNDIAAYLRQRTGQGVCGRFTEDQLHQAAISEDDYLAGLLKAGFGYIQKLAAILAFVLFLQQPAMAQTVKHPSTQYLGKPAVPQQSIRQPQIIKPDSTKAQQPDPVIMGRIAPPPPENHVQGAPKVITVKGKIKVTPKK